MKNKKILILAFVVSLLVASSCGTASAFEGRDDLGMPGSSGSSSGGGADHKLVWTHYSFNSETGLKDQAIWLVPQYITNTSGSGWASGQYYTYKTQNDYKYAERVKIDGECAQPDVGFWALTLSTSGSEKVDGYYLNDEVYEYYDKNLSASANSTYRNETQTTYLTSSKLLPAFSDSRGTYISGNSYVIYRNAGKNGYSPYHTVSFNNSNNTGISYQIDNQAIPNNPQTLYYYNGSKMYAMYTSDMIASSEEDIYKSYATFYRKQYGETISKEQVPEKMAGNDGKGTYAFCSFDSKNVENTINSKTSISIDGTKTSASSDWNKSTTNNNVYITNNNKIKLTTKFVYSRNDNDDTTVVANFNRTESPAGASASSGTGSIGIGIKDIDSQYASKEYEITEANKEITICSSTSHSHLIEINSEGFTETNTASSKACIKVKYIPNVAVIDSKTTLAVNGLSKESGPDENDELNLGRVPYGARAITAIWSYNLSSSSRCIESNFNGTSCSENNSSITSDFKVNYKRSGVAYNDPNYDDQFVTLRNSKYSSSVGSNTKTYNLLPGEQLTQKQGISHYSGVRTDGVAAKGAKEESSSVTLNATASDVICGLNNQPFGLSDPVNYGRMKVVKNGNRTYVYGDNLVDGSSTWSDAGDIWLRPTDTVQLSYEGCIGEQIAKDKDVADWNAQITEDYKNSIMGVETTDGLLNDPHYTGTGNSIDKDGVNSKNITAHEVLGSTINKHIDAKYQFGEQITKPAQVGNVGRTIINDYKIRSDGSRNVSATMKIPYNYILEPEISAGTKEIVTLGNENTFTISVKNPEVRINTKVQNDAYQTDVKPGTKATYLKFVAKTDTSASVLASLNGEFISGDKTGDIVSTLSGIDFKNPSGGNITLSSNGEVVEEEETVKVSADESDSEYNKLCVAVAVYPADSHNLRGATKIENEDQSAALTDSIDGGYTRIAVACKTVGKYPTTSVEGNGIVAGGNVTGAYTEYNNRYFGSWTEYSLIANSVQNFASGASMAYTNPQTSINATAAWNLGGLNKGYFDSPQTLGNMSDDVGLQNDAETSLRVSQMQSFVDDVKSTFFAGEPGDSGIIESSNDNKTFINANYDDDVIIGTELANDINDKANEGMVLIYSQGDIKISNQVQSLKAVLIADGKVDTCSDADQGGDNGQLLDSCYNPLVINGVVFSNGDIALDRVYGGGSTDGMNLDSNTLIQRAEIFNFNPEIVEWGYNYKHKTQPITTTYIEELSTRY